MLVMLSVNQAFPVFLNDELADQTEVGLFAKQKKIQAKPGGLRKSNRG